MLDIIQTDLFDNHIFSFIVRVFVFLFFKVRVQFHVLFLDAMDGLLHIACFNHMDFDIHVWLPYLYINDSIWYTKKYDTILLQNGLLDYLTK